MPFLCDKLDFWELIKNPYQLESNYQSDENVIIYMWFVCFWANVDFASYWKQLGRDLQGPDEDQPLQPKQANVGQKSYHLNEN